MKLHPLIPSSFCVLAGLVFLYQAAGSHGNDWEMPLAFGLYFIGKGLFVYSILSIAKDYKKN